jgi:hypothetical protein
MAGRSRKESPFGSIEFADSTQSDPAQIMFARQGTDRQARRQFLLASTALAAHTLTGADRLPAAPGGIVLRPSGGNLFRVRVEMRVEGNVNVPNNPRVSRETDVRLPIESDAVFDYEERYHRTAGGDHQAFVALVERYYHKARNQSRVNRQQHDIGLRDSVRQTIVCRQTLPEVIYAVDDYFDHGELELLRLPVSSDAVDRLLPSGAIEAGSRYEPSRDAFLAVLNLTSIEASEVWGEVVSISDSDAKIQFRGKINGSVEGVPTVIHAAGKLRFDRSEGTSTWLAMGIHETREAGEAEPGFDVAATVKMIRQPLDQAIALPPIPPRLDVRGKIPSDRLYVGLESKQVGIRALMDRRWRMMSDVPGLAMMRMIVNDRSIAQCDIRPLAAVQPGNQLALEAFQEDVRRMLGTQLSDLIEADQRVSDAGLRVLRVVARGSVQKVPIQWVMLHLSNDSGRRVLASFTMEGRNAERFAGSDIQLAAALRFTELPERKAADTARRNPQKTAAARVAAANSGEDFDSGVQSASDLR